MPPTPAITTDSVLYGATRIAAQADAEPAAAYCELIQRLGCGEAKKGDDRRLADLQRQLNLDSADVHNDLSALKEALVAQIEAREIRRELDALASRGDLVAQIESLDARIIEVVEPLLQQKRDRLHVLDQRRDLERQMHDHDSRRRQALTRAPRLNARTIGA